MKKIVLLLLCLVFRPAQGQAPVSPMPSTSASFIAPDTVCVNELFNVQNTSTGNISSYYWNACGSTAPMPVSASSFTNVQQHLPLFLSINKDGPDYYIFTSDLTRLSYNGSLYNPPAVTVLSNTMINLPHAPIEGIWIEKEGSTWYGILVGGTGGQGGITRLNFGSSLSNTPTDVYMGNIGALDFPHRLHIFRTGGNVYGLTVNRNTNSITRFDFGNSLGNIPTGINMGNIGGLDAPVDFSIVSYGNNWYVFVANNGNHTLTRLDFGNSLLNTPTGTNLGTIGVTAPRGISIWTECDEIKGLILSEVTNDIYTLSFPAGVTGGITAVGNNTITSFNFPHCLQRQRFGDVMFAYISSVNNNTLVRVDYPTCNVVPSSTLQTPPAIAFTTPGTYTLHLTCNETLIDQSSYCKVITVIGGSLHATSTPTAICAGSGATLSATGATSYTWQPGNITGSTLAVTPAIPTTYTVSGPGSSGCVSSYTLALNVNTPVHISASSSPDLVCPGDASTLTAGGALNYTWFPGNLSGASVVVFPNASTVYTVTGSTGACSNSAVTSVLSGLQVTVSSSGNLCNNSSASLYASPSGSSYTSAWSGPGIAGPGNTATITVTTGGTYSVTVTNTLTNCSGTATFYVPDVSNPLVIEPLPSFTNACFPGPPVNILVSQSANFSWLPAAEVTPNTGPLVSVSPSVTSSYTVLATLGTCTGSAVVTISVAITPTLFIAPKNPMVCAGNSTGLSVSGATDYNWQPGNLSGAAITVNPFSTTVYTVTGSNGNCSSTGEITLTALPKPDLQATALPATLCIGQTSTLTGSGAPNLVWLLSDPPPLSFTALISPTTSTTYTLVGINPGGCSRTITLEVHVIDSPAISALSSQTSICAGESITLTASGAASYTWFPGFQVAPVIINTPSASLVYTVLSGDFQCSYATLFIAVNECPNIAFGITNMAGEPEELSGGLYRIPFTITAVNLSQNALTAIKLEDNLEKTFSYPLSYTVVNAPRLISQNSSLKANPLFDGRNDLSLTAVSESSLSAGEVDTLGFTVIVDPKGFHGILKNSVTGFATDNTNRVLSDSSNNGFLWDPDHDGNPTNNNEVTLITLNLFELFIPNGFSPDGDGINDRFAISGLNGRHVKLSVFNRWGNKVYEKNNYDNSWDGAPNAAGLIPGNGKVPEATYYYVVQFLDGKKETKTGFIVIRYL